MANVYHNMKEAEGGEEEKLSVLAKETTKNGVADRNPRPFLRCDFQFYDQLAATGGFSLLRIFWKQRYSGINGSYDEDVENNLLSGDAFGDGMRLQPFTGENVKKVDICVYGGTSAGVTAAYTARQAGRAFC